VQVGVPVEQVDAHVADRRVARDQDEARMLGRRVEAELRDVSLARGAYCVVGHGVTVDSPVVRIVVARCQVDYAGRLSAHLPLATRVLMLKSDGSVLIHSDGGSYKPLNWMSPPCTVREGVAEDGRAEWLVTATKSDDTLRILIDEVLHDSSHDLGVDPGLQKDGVEKHLQELLAEHPATLADGLTLVRREYMTAIGPVDLMCRDADGLSVAVEIKRRGEIDGVEQLTRYLDLLNRDPLLSAKGPVRGIFAAQEIKPQARVLATDRGIACALVDYDALRGMDDAEHRLF
jgi:RecB family endonuclease NucS